MAMPAQQVDVCWSAHTGCREQDAGSASQPRSPRQRYQPAMLPIASVQPTCQPQLLHTALTRCEAPWSGGLSLPLGAAAGASESALLPSPRPADSAGAAALGMHDSSVEFL
jgi:hypothetical protein